jgi:hypothetical protein
MFIIDKEKNNIEKISERTFSELGFKERDHLQEWIAKNPTCLGEELLIIQKEFDGFNDTRERLDLLALDKFGNLVIIENKLDDSGRDVTWQALKYASYCSSLSKSQIIKIYQGYLNKTDSSISAEDRISDFFDNVEIEEISLNKGVTQRVMMVAGNFRKEVTSTVLWLTNYNLRIQCFKVTPYTLGEQMLLNVEQIIPMKDAEEYSINMAEKTQEDITSHEESITRHSIRFEFWGKLIANLNQKSSLYQNISPTKYNWISTGSGMRGVGFNFAASKKYGRCEIYIDRGEFAENKKIFDLLFQEKDQIEEEFGGSLVWERLDEKRASRIKYELDTVNVFNKEDWSEMIEFMTSGMIRFEKVFQNRINKINALLKR